MEFFIGLAVGYIAIGAITARRVFVNYINEHGRNHLRDTDSAGYALGEPHDPFAEPFWAGVFWWIVIPVMAFTWLWNHVIERPTPAERRATAAEKARKLAKEQQRYLDLARAEGLPVDITPDTIIDRGGGRNPS
jgi:hypothetical protein